jgi:LCP family protein required for cell wall assembly
MLRKHPFWYPVVITATVMMFVFSMVLGFMLPVITRFAVLEMFLTMTPKTVIMDQEFNLIALGSDVRRGGSRSDTVMVLHVNPKKSAASIISIPRDTLVSIPGRGLDKLGHAFAYGGPDLARKTIEGFLNINIPYYVSVDIPGLEKIIDEIGGIEMNVEKRMYYIDYAQGLYVNLYPGFQRLNGRDTLSYVRFRHDSEGDFGRINRQQKFLQILADTLMKKENMFKTPQLFTELLSNIETNLDSRQILSIAMSMREAQEKHDIKMATIPGYGVMVDGVYYLQPDQNALTKITESMLGRPVAQNNAP